MNGDCKADSNVLPLNGTAVFVWGSHRHGQLGIGTTEQTHVFTPTELVGFKARHVQYIASGEQHTLFIMKDGTVYSCGQNDLGQLGHGETVDKPGMLSLRAYRSLSKGHEC